ncbi:MAG TPA: hypothetical protein VMP67_10320 [Candidatus Limnocylindria bacterium]|nr:hypothetical protein [Candidatus Limnocylindria bacterium]
MDGPDWLRIQMATFTCPACSRRYRSSRVRLLAEREGLFFVDLDCSQCGSHTVAIVTVEQDDAEAAIADLPRMGPTVEEHLGERLPRGASPVTADDVLEMHEFLAHFHGDVDGLFRAAARRSSGA